MGSHLKERLCAPDSRLVGMFVKFPTLETIEILASAGCDFVIIDMEHAPLSTDTVYGMIVAATAPTSIGVAATAGSFACR
jgi:2-keto-3-deoxy-L-rhamnonate aldolase RhmA